MLETIGAIVEIGKAGADAFKAVTEAIKRIQEARSVSKPETQQLLDGPIETLRDKVAEFQQKHLELQGAALALSEKNMALVEQVRATQKKLAKLQKFDADRDKYVRVALALNTFAYGEKAFQGPAKDQPLLCPNCFDKSKKTYLSFQQHAMRTNEMKCTACNTSVHVPRDDGPAVSVERVDTDYNVFDGF